MYRRIVPALRGLVLVCALALSSSTLAFGELPSSLPAPAFELTDAAQVDTLPLVSQHTTVDVAGLVARIELVQVWENRGKVPLEATYVFPTSTRAAVHDLRMQIGDRRELRAEIRPKEKARQAFDAARDNGQTAGLLEQQRPNAVTMHLTHIMPGDRVRVVVEASELIRPIDGVYELVLPQTLGPRYGGNASRSGTEDFVDNGHVTGASSKVETRVDVTVRSPIGVRGIGSPSHAVAPVFASRDEGPVSIRSSADDVVADRDVILRWRLASDEVQTGVLLYRDRDSGEHTFMVVGEAPGEVPEGMAPPRDVAFVLDVSGSMGGFPLENGKHLVRELLAELRPEDTFNLLFFAGGSAVLSGTGSLPATPTNLQRGRAMLDAMETGGGTELLSALQKVFSLPRGDVDGVTRSRAIVVVTDGMISAERAAFRLVHEHLGDATLFAFGIHGSVNRHLIEGLAAAGRTEPFVVVDAAQAKKAVDHFRTIAARPALTNVRLSFQGFEAHDLEPSAPMDLYPGRPLMVLGRFRGPASGTVVVTGDGVDGPYRREIPIEDHLERREHAPLQTLWARERVARLVDRDAPDDAALQEVEALGLRHRLLTERTSFVVVDPQRRNAGGDLAIVAQPSVVPQDMAGSIGGVSIFGARGIGIRGTGAGGGGMGGFGSGSGRGSGGDGNVDLGGRGKGATKVVAGKVIHEGGLGREAIQRVVTRVMGQIKYCYERELTRDPSLAGRLVMSWRIAGTGEVQMATVVQSTLTGPGGQPTQQCVQRIIQRLMFPAPLGGGVVQVTYPFDFSASGG